MKRMIKVCILLELLLLAFLTFYIVSNNISLKLRSAAALSIIDSMFESSTYCLSEQDLQILSQDLNAARLLDLFYSFSNECEDFSSYKKLDKSSKNALIAALLKLSIKSQEIVPPLIDLGLSQMLVPLITLDDIIYLKTSEDSSLIKLIRKGDYFKINFKDCGEQNALLDIFKHFDCDNSFYSPELAALLNSLTCEAESIQTPE